MKTQPRLMTERELQGSVLDAAQKLRWLCYHSWLSSNSQPGFPDLVLVRPPRIIFCELKSARGRPTAAQSYWLRLLAQCPQVETVLWTPIDWQSGVVEETLR